MISHDSQHTGKPAATITLPRFQKLIRLLPAALLTLVYVNYRTSTPLRGVLLVVFASANLFWDALFHLVMTPILDRYSPGLVTSMLLYYPICILVGLVITKDALTAR